MHFAICSSRCAGEGAADDPNSNAAPERTFSMVKKIFTEQRSQLGKSTLSALLKCKLNEDTICTEAGACRVHVTQQLVH